MSQLLLIKFLNLLILIKNSGVIMDNSERLITAFYYSVGGVILGLGLAIFSSLYLGSTVSSPKIIIFTVISCFVIGYLFPNMVGSIFKWVWRIFVN